MNNKSNIYFLLITTFLVSCSTSEKTQEDNPDVHIQAIKNENLNILKGINIKSRDVNRTVDRFYLNKNGKNYHLPVFINKTREKSLNSEWYDVLKYAKDNGIDSLMAYDYVKSFSDSVLLLYNKSEAMEIFSDTLLGDFLIFRYPKYEILYIFPEGNIRHPHWKSVIHGLKNTSHNNWLIKKGLEQN